MSFKYHTLPTLNILGANSDDLTAASSNAQAIANELFTSFAQYIQAGDVDQITLLFADVFPSWRDFLALSWEFHTKTGKDEIRNFLSTHLTRSQIGRLEIKHTAQLQRPFPDLAWIHADFTFTTEHGIGSGILRLVPVSADGEIKWKIHGVFTNLESLQRFPEKVGALREKAPTHGEWSSRREKELEFAEDPQVLIIGGSQNGLAVAARLKYLGVSALVVEKKARVGDSWRGRYEALSLHDPVWYDHMPYLP
jgi:hypothetical protein